MREPKWLGLDLVIAIHRLQIERYGGDSGIRDMGLLKSALARAQQNWHYVGAGILELGAIYAVAIAKNHAFVDGNKRTAFVASILFLEENGFAFRADQSMAEQVFLRVAEGAMNDVALRDWFESVCLDLSDTADK